MANESQLIDFSLDPFQVEEEQLRERMKQAVTKSLRSTAGLQSWDVGGHANAAFDRVSGLLEMPQIRNQQKALGNKFEESLTQAAGPANQDIIDLLRNPATRAIGLDTIKKRQQERLNLESMKNLEQRIGGEGTPGGAVGGEDKPSLRQVEAMLRHPDERIQAQGKVLYDLYHKPMDPGHTTSRDRSGTVRSIPGAVGALAEREGATAGAKAGAEYPYKDELVTIDLGGGRTQQVPRSVAMRMFGGGPAATAAQFGPAPVQALPSAVGALGTGAAPAGNNPVAGATGPVNAPPGVGPGAVPSLDVFKALERSGPNAVSPKGAIGEWQVMPQNFRPGEDPRNPEHQRAAAQRVIEDARRLYGDNQEAIVAYYNGGRAAGDAVAAGRAPPAKETQDYLARFRAMSPIGTAQAGTPPPRLATPEGQLGVKDPMGMKLLEEQIKSNQAAVEKWQAGLRDIPNNKKILDTIDKIGSNVYGGPLGETLAAIETGVKTSLPFFGGKASQTASNTQVLKSQSQELIGAIQKQYGTNPSNVDFRAAASRVPTGEMTPEARKELVQLMRQGLLREEATTPRIMELLQQRHTLQDAQKIANDEYDAQKARAAGNPNQAGAAPQTPAAAPVPQNQPVPQNGPPGQPLPPGAGPSAGGRISQGNVVAAAQGQPPQRGATGSWGPAEPPPTPPNAGQPVHPPINPAELLTREPRDAYEAKMKDAMERAKREADPQLWEMVVGAIQKGIELPGNLATIEAGAGTVDAYKNLYRGTKQLLTGDYDAAEEQRIRAEQEKKMADPRYAAGMNFSSVANPAALIGGAGSGVLRNAASAWIQSMLQPEESLGDKFNQSFGPTALAGTLSAAAKVVPKTKLPDTAPPGYLEAKDTFPGVRPTSAQLNETGFGANAFGVNEARQVEQIKAISDTIRKAAGIEGNVINQKVLDTGFGDTATKYSALFHDTGRPVGVSINTQEQQALRTRFQNMLNPGTDPTQTTISLNRIFNEQNAPALQRLRQVLEQGATGTIKVNPADLHRAWREVGTIADVNPQAAGQVRGFLEELTGKILSPAKLKEFKELNHRWATLEDIQRVYQMGGEGKGTMSGDFAPSKLEAMMGKGPNPGGVVDQAGHMVKGLRISDFNPKAAPDTLYGVLKQGADRIIGGAQNKLDLSAYNASPTKKHLLELLRAGLVRGIPQTTIQSGSTD